MAIETLKIPASALREIEDKLLESFRWSRDHKGEKYRHAIPCEWCLQQGLLLAMAELCGWNPVEKRAEFVERVNSEKKPKRVVKRAVKKKVVVRRKR